MKRSHFVSGFIFAFISLSVFVPSYAVGDPLRKVAKDFHKKTRSMKSPRVAILSFPYHNGKVSSGSSILSERLTTYMAETRGVRVIERNLLKKILEEQHLSDSGVVDSSSAKKIGKVLDVDLIITGTLIDLESEQTELNARVLRSDTGEVLAANRAVVERSWSDKPRSLTPNDHPAKSEPEAEEKPIENEAIRIGYPGGRGGGRGPWGR
ncbi:MAG: hypothetical protein KCHDKBKB_02719 [Elusimicrobia bacterium]|nr:hypothetical protein [Elusimicrobiota bacterium]